MHLSCLLLCSCLTLRHSKVRALSHHSARILQRKHAARSPHNRHRFLPEANVTCHIQRRALYSWILYNLLPRDKERRCMSCRFLALGPCLAIPIGCLAAKLKTLPSPNTGGALAWPVFSIRKLDPCPF